MEWNIYTSEAAFVKSAAAVIVDACHSQRAVSLALSGGHAPIPVLDYLTKKNTFDPACHVTLFQVDERYVPASHPESNQKLLIDHLVRPLQKQKEYDPIAEAHFFDTSLSIRKALSTYRDVLKNQLHSAEYLFDLCVLGVGDDGHTASLFPKSKALRTKKLVAHTQTEDTDTPDRLTIAFPAIMQSKHILVLLQGADDKAVLDELKNGTKSVKEYPSKKLLEHPNVTILFGDY